MSTSLAGKKILILSTNYGPETAELMRPLTELRQAGAEVTLAAPTADPIQPLTGDVEPAEPVTPTATFAQVNPKDYDALVVPGGTLNADALRMDDTARHTARSFARAGKPIAMICHAPWLLVDADLAADRKLTSWRSIAPDLQHAGSEWTDEEVVVDNAGGWTLITSRSPDDLDAFIDTIEATLTA